MITLSKKYLIILIFISLLMTSFYIFNSFESYYNFSDSLFRQITMVFVCLGISTIFLLNYKKKIKGVQKKFYKATRAFLFLNAFCGANFLVVLLEQGLKTGEELFWQISAIFLSIYITAILINLIRKRETNKHIPFIS